MDPIEHGDIPACYVSLPEGTLPETNSSPLKTDPWNLGEFLLETTISRGENVSLPGRVIQNNGTAWAPKIGWSLFLRPSLRVLAPRGVVETR